MTTTKPDDAAMPFSHPDYSPEPSLTAREYAGIHLLQPTGTPWLDEMIEARRREEFAKAVLAQGHHEMAKDAWDVADAMLSATRPAGSREGGQ